MKTVLDPMKEAAKLVGRRRFVRTLERVERSGRVREHAVGSGLCLWLEEDKVPGKLDRKL